MKLGKSLASVAISASLLVSPIAAQAAMPERASTAIEGEELGGNPVVLGLAFLVVFGVVAWLIAESDDPEETPTSP